MSLTERMLELFSENLCVDILELVYRFYILYKYTVQLYNYMDRYNTVEAQIYYLAYLYGRSESSLYTLGRT